MIYNGPKNCDTFLDFINKSFVKYNNKEHPLSGLINVFQQLIRILELEMLIDQGEKYEDLKLNMDNVRYITVTDIRDDDKYFSTVISIINLPLINTSFMIKLKDIESSEFLIDIIKGSMLNSMVFNSVRYTKDIYFIRTSGKDATPIYVYKESRYHIYNNNLIDLDYDDIALDTRITYKYSIAVFKNLYEEIINNFHDFYYIELKESV